jgi:hypothetical protein
MPDFTLTTYEAQPSGSGFAIRMHLGGGNPVPRKTVSAKTTAEALRHLAAHVQEVAALNKPVVVSIDVAQGQRAPSGWRALAYRDKTISVNLHS